MKIKKHKIKTVKTTVFIFLLLCVFSAFNFAGQMPDKYKRKRIGEGVTLLIPDNFVEMSDEEIAAKYFTPKRPLAIFRSPDRRAEIGVNSSLFEWGEVGLESELSMELLMGFYKGAIANSFYEKVKFLNEGEIINLGSREGVLFEFIGAIPEDPNAIINQGGKSRYHQVLYSVYNGKVLIVNFNVSGTDYKYWREHATKMVTSVKI
ncbi:hypothetical protein [Bernardetia sp.]|uniref:hypothetical protein n=1 Tax=Bernardetia sp. TaxID=1937974 RepID=UPI0025C40E9F|nr:hypothetical protein [Bernardetia sp.]